MTVMVTSTDRDPSSAILLLSVLLCSEQPALGFAPSKAHSAIVLSTFPIFRPTGRKLSRASSKLYREQPKNEHHNPLAPLPELNAFSILPTNDNALDYLAEEDGEREEGDGTVTSKQPKPPSPTYQASDIKETTKTRPDSLDSFEVDITTILKELRNQGPDPSLPKLFRNINMPSFTNIWSQQDWDLHTSRWRFVKYMLALPTSRLLRRVAPQLTACVLWSIVACWVCSKEVHGILSRAVLPLAPLSLVSTFVAGLLTLRSNQGLSRLNEGRFVFGKVVLYTRDMAQQIATILYPKNRSLALLAARHVALFGWVLKDFLRHYDEDYKRPWVPYRPTPCQDEDLITTLLPNRQNPDNPSEDARFLLRQRKKPVAICTRLRQIFAAMRPHLNTSEQSRLDICAHELNKCITVCERIRASPIPPLYTAHAGRLLILYLFFLPLALRGSNLLDGVGTVITTTAVGYAMLGLDEISHILEEPFRLMPLYHLSKNSMKDVADALVCQPPELMVEDEDGDSMPVQEATSSITYPTYW